MNDATLEELMRRVHRLERAHRRWRRGALSGLIGLLALALMGQARLGTAPKLIEAERFVVRDASGKMRVLLGDTGTGVPALIFFDEREKTRALLGIRADSG